MKKTQITLCREMFRKTVTAGWVYTAFQLAFLPELLLYVSTVWRLPEAVTNLIYYSVNFLFTLWIFRDFLWDNLEAALRHPLRLALAVLPGFALHWGAGQLFGALTAHLAPGFANANDEAVAAMLAFAPRLMPIALTVLVPPAEECLFRGLIFARLWPKSKILAYGLSIAAFCFVHVAGYIGQIPPVTLVLCILQYVPAGLILALSYRSSGSLLAPILIHAAANAAACLQVMR